MSNRSSNITPSPLAASVRGGGLVTLLGVGNVAVAQSGASGAASGAVVRSGFLGAFDRLDSLGVTLIVVAVLVVLLLGVRIAQMVRRERPRAPAALVATRRPRRTDDEALDRPTLQGATNWGSDQNKRAAQSREAVRVDTTQGSLQSFDQAATQWSNSEVHNAAEISLQANESMGKSPNAPASPYRTAFNPYYRDDAPTRAVDVVEVADTLLQAELLVQLGDPKQAMTMLSNHIRDTEKPGPAVWLMLLNLYQATGRKSQYEALANGFGTLFNAAVPGWAESRQAATRDLESYPQVMLKVHALWGKPDVRPLLEGLLNDDRGGSRQGFSLAAYREILFLVEIVDMLEKMVTEDLEREDIQRKLGRIG